jgi:thioredoxin 1
VAPVLEDLAKQWEGRVQVVKVNVDEEPALADAFKIRSIPTLVAMRGRSVVDVQLGAGSAAHIERLFEAAEAAEVVDEEEEVSTESEDRAAP